jgi:hypothetical protein
LLRQRVLDASPGSSEPDEVLIWHMGPGGTAGHRPFLRDAASLPNVDLFGRLK